MSIDQDRRSDPEWADTRDVHSVKMSNTVPIDKVIPLPPETIVLNCQLRID